MPEQGLIRSPRNVPGRRPVRRLAAAAALLAAALAPACASRRAPPPAGPLEVGVASWYGDDFHGRTTSSGDRYSMYGLTAASRTLPLGTRVKVTRADNGRSVEVTVNDRGPFVEGRILDLSYEAARRLDMLETGIATVSITLVAWPPGAPAPPAPVSGPAVAGVSAPTGAPAPATAPPAVPGERARWWVSLGVFGREKGAEWLARRLPPGLPVSLTRLEAGGAVAHRLVVGPQSSRAEAERVLRLLAESGLKGTLLPEGTAD